MGDTMRESRFESNEPRMNRLTSGGSLRARFASLPLPVQTLMVDSFSAELSEGHLLPNESLLEVLQVLERSGKHSSQHSIDRTSSIVSAASDDAPSDLAPEIESQGAELDEVPSDFISIDPRAMDDMN